MKKTCKVFQIRKDAPDRHYKAFESYDRLKEFYGDVDFSDYECVWEGTVSDEASLDDIFEMCNLYHPEGYKGHSLSVSDIVEMDGKKMYCDSIGFTEVRV